MLLLLVSSILLVLFIYIGLPYIIKYLMIWNFFSNFKKTNAICLTFDDGPHPLLTPRILNILKQEGVKATFFLMGKNAEKYPELVSKIREGGHDIGEHSYNHCHPWKSFPTTCITDIKEGSKVVKPWYRGKKYSLYRPPFGKLNIISLIYLLFIKKSRIIYWNIDTRDYEKKSGRAVANVIVNRILPGSVILMHDGREENKEITAEQVEPTVEGLRLALEELKDYKHHFKTIREVLDIL
jgi:peptidoglycan/xylan/chitin deacetylase (PgdA/CDA1 family)